MFAGALKFTVTRAFPAVAYTFVGAFGTVTVIPACVTVTVFDNVPEVTVTVPVLDDVDAFSSALSVNVPLPVPLAGDTVSQSGALLSAVHEVFEFTVMLVIDLDAAGFHTSDDKDK